MQRWGSLRWPLPISIQAQRRQYGLEGLSEMQGIIALWATQSNRLRPCRGSSPLFMVTFLRFGEVTVVGANPIPSNVCLVVVVK